MSGKVHLFRSRGWDTSYRACRKLPKVIHSAAEHQRPKQPFSVWYISVTRRLCISAQVTIVDVSAFWPSSGLRVAESMRSTTGTHHHHEGATKGPTWGHPPKLTNRGTNPVTIFTNNCGIYRISRYLRKNIHKNRHTPRWQHLGVRFTCARSLSKEMVRFAIII